MSAVKLRIDVPVLLEMVEARVAERDAVQRLLRALISYSLVERSGQDELNEQERNVLHFVDGRQSVNSIAQALRDSSLNVACYLTSLQQQGFVAPRVSGATSRIQAAVDTSVPPTQPQQKSSSTTVNLSALAAPPQAASAIPPERETVPVDHVTNPAESGAVAAAAAEIMSVPRKRVIVEQPRIKFSLYLLLIILMVVIGLLVLVMQANERRRTLMILLSAFELLSTNLSGLLRINW